MFKCLSVTITATTALWLLGASLTMAATKKPQPPDEFPPSPLEITTPDPLLPRNPDKDKQPLSVIEQQKLETELDKLNQQATAKLQAGDELGAFDIWNRELRLRRYLGSLKEVQALGRVGAVAYQKSNRPQIRYITQRLQAIQKQAQSQKTPDLELLQALGQAYQQVRSPENAVEAYQQVLTAVRQQQNTAKEVEILQAIAQVHLSWFDYSKAADTYQELLKLATAKGDSVNELVYLQRLAYIYEHGKQPQQAIEIQNRLAQIYQRQNNPTQLPALKLAIGSDYESLAKKNPNLLQEAFNNYQQAYTIAWQSQQYVRAGEALQKLITLYRSQGQIQEALQASEILVQTQQLASNFYGLMNAYDQIGKMHLERKDYPQALQAFQKGLEVAQQLKYEEDYFSGQIQKLSGQNPQ
ncbi:MAG: tetratricopeptide repeat protein [Pelatocladus maniniholoensis HA4357-MV3]|jgi:tetratricopeptide (TPR) repeat protein|uniref:Tetratricopeptide repeat protein n=1 Tax=Pelatocladus maniniholoensis HA4357-MV3 TaxID=1117104 RepID=A0A9E3HA16_9NOST|nr:tetratricopeptide repeat protein [Pelatocladus maniniholoensis HA4357-MV3]BAZ68901.1 TPR repeat-containing protein [Fischerella sp. NIES-4106]